MTTKPGTDGGSAELTLDGTTYRLVPGTDGLLLAAPPTTSSTGTGTSVSTPPEPAAGTGAGTVATCGSTVPVPAVPAPTPAKIPGTVEPEPAGTVPAGSGSRTPNPATHGPGAAELTRAARAARVRLTHGAFYRSLLTAVVATVASLGQIDFAKDHHFVGKFWLNLGPGHVWDVTPYLAVAVFDLAVAALLFAGKERYEDDFSPWPCWVAAAGAAGVSVWTNAHHDTAWITAPASGVLFLLWFLKLWTGYQVWRRGKGRTAAAAPQLLASKLTLISPGLAHRAWVISAERPLDLGVEYRQRAHGEDIRPRDLAVLVARLYRDTLTDRRATELAGLRWWQRGARRLATQRAEMTATDTVDRYLGLPVINRTGIQVSRVTYLEPEPTPTPRPTRPATAPTEPGEQLTMRISAPPRRTPPTTAPAVPAPAAAEGDLEVPEVLLLARAELIDQVKERVGDAWWSGEKPLSVDQVQKELRTCGVGNRTTATQVARCLRYLRHQKFAEPAP